MYRRSLTLTLVLVTALASILLNVVTNDLTNGPAQANPALRALSQWSLPALGILVVLLLGGQGLLFVLERPARRAWSARRPPYPGLEPFSEEDAAVFFGRDRETKELLDRLSPTLGRQAHRFVPVVGPSGSGKTSLVHAGLLAGLAARRQRWLTLPTVVPEDQPLRNLARALAAHLSSSVDELAGRLAADGGALGRCLEELRLAAGARSAAVLLVVDQAEELFTMTSREEREAFLGLLRTTLGQDHRLWVVATLRSDFLDDFLAAGWTDLFLHPVVVGPPSRAALFEIIERPAAQAGLRFAPGLVGRMVDDAGGGDALPMLAYTLQALYLRVGHGGLATERDYEQLGGVVGALSDQADRVAAALRVAGERDVVLPTLLRFVALDESGPVPRRVPRTSLDAGERRVVDAFVAARLLTSDAGSGGAVVQVAHEALFRRWPPLRQAVEAASETLQRRSQLERWALDWARAGRRDSYLLTGERLESAQQAARALGAGLRGLPLVAEFLEQSARLDRAALTRLSQAVAAQATGFLSRDPERATLLALAAVEECAVTPAAWRALASAAVNPGLRVLRGHVDGLWAVTWSPDGRRLATSSEDLTARIWDPARGVQLTVLQGHREGVLAVAWSPDGERLATASRDRTLRVWAAAGAPLLTLPCAARLRSVEWSPDGLLVAVGGEDGTVRIVDASSGAERCVLGGHDGWVRTLAWSAGGLLASGGDDRAVRLWDPRTGALRFAMHGHTARVATVAWSADGRRLASASGDGTARTWDPGGQGESLVLAGHDDGLRGVAWSPDAGRLATASYDHTLRIWDATDGTCLAILRGHESGLAGVAWSPGGRLLATASEDRTARVWEADHGTELSVIRGHLTTVHSVAWSADGRRLATASRDRTARVWDAERGRELLALLGHEDSVRAVAWSPEGRRLATASADRTVRVWDAEEGHCLRRLEGHEEPVRTVAWSPEGRRLLTGAEDRSARVWDVVSGRELAVLRGHRDWVRSAAWSPEGRRLATGSRDGSAMLWDAGRAAMIAELDPHGGRLRSLAWSPEGGRIATVGDDATVRVWDAERGDQLAVLRGHEGPVRGVAWSPEGRLLATSSSDRTVRTWDVERRTELAVVGVHDDLGEGVAWSPDGRRIASASRDQTVRIWDASGGLERLIAIARARVGRELTAAERREAMLP